MSGIFSKDCEDEAAEWFSLMNDQAVGDELRLDFERWCRKTPENQEAYTHISSLWQSMDEYSDAREMQPYLMAATQSLNKPLHKMKHFFQGIFGRPVLSGVMAAALLLIVTAAFYYTSPFPQRDGIYQTERARQEVVLADGTRIVLNINTQIKVWFDEKRRLIDLSRGQAYFSVAKDKKRPFTVNFGKGSVTALGTEFEVYRRMDDVTVSLIEGSVKVQSHALSGVAQNAPSPEREVMITANPNSISIPQLLVSDHGMSDIAHNPLEEISAWQKDRLVFNDLPLEAALREVNRYSAHQIIIGDPTLREMRLSGVFPSNDSQIFIRALRTYYDITVERDQRKRIILRSVSSS